MHYGSGIQTKNGLLSDIKSNLAKRIAHTVAEELKGKQCADKK